MAGAVRRVRLSVTEADGRRVTVTHQAADKVLPRGEDLRRAVRWIGEHGDHSARAVEEAALRYDLSPLDEAFLLRFLVERRRDLD